jgi:hypothetical protein
MLLYCLFGLGLRRAELRLAGLNDKSDISLIINVEPTPGRHGLWSDLGHRPINSLTLVSKANADQTFIIS